MTSIRTLSLLLIRSGLFSRVTSGLTLVSIVCAFSFFGLPSFALIDDDANWPQWRGPSASGVSYEKNLPIEWSESQNVQWKTTIPGRGHSSPVIWGKKVFLTTSIEGPVVP